MVTVVLKSDETEYFLKLTNLIYELKSLRLFSMPPSEKKCQIDAFLETMIAHREKFDFFREEIERKPLEIPVNAQHIKINHLKYEKRYSVLFDRSLEELETHLNSNSRIEIAGQPHTDPKIKKAIENQLKRSFISFHIDIFDEKNSEWVSFKTITQDEIYPQSKACTIS